MEHIVTVSRLTRVTHQNYQHCAGSQVVMAACSPGKTSPKKTETKRDFAVAFAFPTPYACDLPTLWCPTPFFVVPPVLEPFNPAEACFGIFEIVDTIAHFLLDPFCSTGVKGPSLRGYSRRYYDQVRALPRRYDAKSPPLLFAAATGVLSLFHTTCVTRGVFMSMSSAPNSAKALLLARASHLSPPEFKAMMQVTKGSLVVTSATKRLFNDETQDEMRREIFGCFFPSQGVFVPARKVYDAIEARSRGAAQTIRDLLVRAANQKKTDACDKSLSKLKRNLDDMIRKIKNVEVERLQSAEDLRAASQRLAAAKRITSAALVRDERKSVGKRRRE